MKTPGPISVRRATVDDAAAISELADALLSEIMAAIGVNAFDSDPAAIRDQLCQSIPRNQHVVLLVEKSGAPVGFAALSPAFAMYTNGSYGIITELFVLPTQRSQSIGKCLVQECKSFAAEMGWNRLEVTTPPLPEFDRTLRFYEDRGFEITGGRKLQIPIG